MDKLMLKTVFVSYMPLFLVFLVEADEIASAYGQTIKLASGYEQLIKESPATVSVITKVDIKRIGAITIEDMLETIPGIHVSYAMHILAMVNTDSGHREHFPCPRIGFGLFYL